MVECALVILLASIVAAIFGFVNVPASARVADRLLFFIAIAIFILFPIVIGGEMLF